MNSTQLRNGLRSFLEGDEEANKDAIWSEINLALAAWVEKHVPPRSTTKIAAAHGIRLPPGLRVLGRTDAEIFVAGWFGQSPEILPLEEKYGSATILAIIGMHGLEIGRIDAAVDALAWLRKIQVAVLKPNAKTGSLHRSANSRGGKGPRPSAKAFIIEQYNGQKLSHLEPHDRAAAIAKSCRRRVGDTNRTVTVGYVRKVLKKARLK